MYISTSYYRVLVQQLRVFRRKRGPEARRTGIPCDIAWNDSSHSILNEFMHAEYGIFVYIHNLATFRGCTPIPTHARRRTACNAARDRDRGHAARRGPAGAWALQITHALRVPASASKPAWPWPRSLRAPAWTRSSGCSTCADSSCSPLY